MFHPFRCATADIPLPARFTFPFQYEPHPLCVMAAEELCAYLEQQSEWAEELSGGKMLGVLVVERADKVLGFLAAFSGNLAGSNRHPYFVPPVFDMLQPGDFFRTGEAQISAINRQIELLESDPLRAAQRAEWEQHLHENQQTLDEAKALLKARKATRDQIRQSQPDETLRVQLERESQHQKAEYKRLERQVTAEMDLFRQKIKQLSDETDQLKQERKQRSAALQQQLFDRFRLLNARGEERGLNAIFAATVQQTPPAGAGECAAPKLLQYAYGQGLRPVAMAEFWWGASPKTEIRQHGHYYPACKGKCEPILGHMLQGLEVDEDPMLQQPTRVHSLRVMYEDAYLLVVDKPAGLLSVPGRMGQESVVSLLAQGTHAGMELWPVHRLDMGTSGLLMLAKTPVLHKQLQAMFKRRTIRKRYIALIEGSPEGDGGDIQLPLIADYWYRPRQKVDYEQGKPAFTRWEIIRREDNHTRIAFYPLTGRTHQLRVHAAHPAGLGCPIVGDPLYGQSAARLYLHAAELSLVHPVSGKDLLIVSNPEF